MKKSSLRAQQTKRTHCYSLLVLESPKVLTCCDGPCWCSRGT